MRKLFKIFAIWLIAIAIPVQGFASIAMMNFEQSSNHHSQNNLESNDHHHAQQGEHDTSIEHTHSSVDDNQVSQNADKNEHSCAHCVKCTSCCSGFTFQNTASSLFDQLNASEARLVFNSIIFTGFISSGPERPPRLTLI